MILCSRLSAIPIQRAKHVVQENQALLAQPVTQNAPRSIERSTVRVGQPGAFSPQHRGRGRGMGGKRGRGQRGHCHTPQSRRPTLLEMVRQYMKKNTSIIPRNYKVSTQYRFSYASPCCIFIPLFFLATCSRYPPREKRPPAVRALRRQKQLLWSGAPERSVRPAGA